MFERVGVAGLGEGGCAGANQCTHEQKCSFPTKRAYPPQCTHEQKRSFLTKKAYPPSNRDLVISVQNRFYYWGVYDNTTINLIVIFIVNLIVNSFNLNEFHLSHCMDFVFYGFVLKKEWGMEHENAHRRQCGNCFPIFPPR